MQNSHTLDTDISLLEMYFASIFTQVNKDTCRVGPLDPRVPHLQIQLTMDQKHLEEKISRKF